MAYEKVAEYPDDLKKLIKAINSLPKKIEAFYSKIHVEFVVEMSRILTKGYDNENGMEKDLAQLQAECDQMLQNLLPKDVSAYILKPTEDLDLIKNPAQINPALNRLFELMSLEHLFIHLVKNNPFDFVNYTFRPVVDFAIDADGNIKPVMSSGVELFNRYNIKLERIRICPICEDIYFAKRDDQPACSTQHAGTLRQKKFQSKKKEIKNNDTL